MEYLIFIAIAVLFITIIVADYKYYKTTTYFDVTHNSYLSVKFNTGTKGEYRLYRYLQEFEQLGCKFLFNLYVPRENGKTSEIDIVMFHPKGLFVIESKNFSGWIFGNERNKQWTQTFPTGDKYRFYNPIMQNATHIRAIRKLIDDTIPVYSVVAFSDDCTLKNVTTNSNVILTYYSAISKSIKLKLSDIVGNVVNDELLENTYNNLFPYSQSSIQVKAEHLQNLK